MKMTNEEMVARYQKNRATRTVVQGAWNDVNRYVSIFAPDEFQIDTTENAAQWDLSWLYDSTGVYAHQTLAASIHANLTSPSAEWFLFAFRENKANKLVNGQKWLEEVSEITYDAIQESNFNLQISEYYNALTAYGNGHLAEEDMGDGKLKFLSIPVRNGFPEKDADDNNLIFYRQIKWTALQIISKFGKRCPKWVREKSKSSVDEKIELIYVVFPRNNKEADMLAPKERPWGYKYILTQDAHLLEEGGYYEMPIFSTRWLTKTDSQWGYSPAMIAMPDIKTLNTNIKLRLQGMAKEVSPPIGTTARGAIKLDLNPNGVSQFRSKDDVFNLPVGSNWGINDAEIARLTDSIRQAFHIDQLQLREAPNMTATEVQIRYEMMQRVLGPVLSRIQSELLTPMLMRTLKILQRAGKLPPMPQDVMELQPEMDIVYLGPMARAQKMDEAQGTERLLGTVTSLGIPQLAEGIDYDQAARILQKGYGAPAVIMKPQSQIDEERQQKQAQIKQQQEAELMSKAGPGMKATAEGMKTMQETGINPEQMGAANG